MKRSILSVALVLLCLAAFACDQGQGFTSSPVAPETANLTSITDAVKVKIKICHWSPDWELDGDPFEYTVVAISGNGNSPAAHSEHGDPTCDVSGLEVGSDCESTCFALSAVTAAAKAPPALICHNDVDDDHPYDSIAIEVNGNSVGKHLDNHGDCYTSDPEGTEDCGCVA